MLLGHSQSPEGTSGNCSLGVAVSIFENIFFFCEHVIAPWNSLNIVSDDQRSVDTFRRLDVRSDLSSFVYY